MWFLVLLLVVSSVAAMPWIPMGFWPLLPLSAVGIIIVCRVVHHWVLLYRAHRVHVPDYVDEMWS